MPIQVAGTWDVKVRPTFRYDAGTVEKIRADPGARFDPKRGFRTGAG